MSITKNVFYPNRFTQDEQREITRSLLWPLISGFHYKTNGKLFLSKIYTDEITGVLKAIMCVIDGWPVLNIKRNPAALLFQVSVIDGDGGILDCAETANISYILKRVNDRKQTKKRGKKYPLGHSLHTTIERWTRASPQSTFYDYFEQAVAMFSAKLRGDLPSASTVGAMTSLTRWHAVRIAMGDATIDTVPDSVKAEFVLAHSAIRRREEMEESTKETISDMFPADKCKWVLFYQRNYGYIAMKFRPTKLAEWSNNYVFPDINSRPDIMSSDIEVVVPLTYYPTLRDLPPEHAIEILPRLNFAKVNRSTSGTGIAAADPDGFIHSRDFLQERIGCITKLIPGYSMIIFDA